MPPKELAAMQSHCAMQRRWCFRRARFGDVNQSTVATQRLALGLTSFPRKAVIQAFVGLGGGPNRVNDVLIIMMRTRKNGQAPANVK